MHPRTTATAYMSVRHHEQPPSPYTTTHHHIVATAQTLASLHTDVKRLREVEHLLQRQIHRYRSSLDEVQTMLYAKINKANEMQNWLAPVSRLPNEMLLMIFEEVVACQDPVALERAELTISKVSRRWRDLAIHSPRLWRRVCIAPRVSPTMLEMYKTRATSALDIDIWGWKDRRDFQRFDAALERMLDSASRWHSLSIASVCDSHLSHLTLKLSQVGHFSGLEHFTFRALRPGQTCSIAFLMEAGTSAHPPTVNQALASCALKSLDAENFTLTGDLGGVLTRTMQNFAGLSSLTLRRYSNDARSFRITIDFGAFRAMLSAIPNLRTLVLHGQPLRFRTDLVGSLHGGVHASGFGTGDSIGGTANASTISLPHLHTLVLHPGVLKPRYLQHTIAAIHAPALGHFELVFPDSKLLGQNIVEQLFVDTAPSCPSSASSTEECMRRRRRPRFPRVETLVLNNATSPGTALAFMHAFPCTTALTLGGVDVGFFSLVLRSSTGPTGTAGCTRSSGGTTTESLYRPGTTAGLETGARDHACPRLAPWPRLDTLMLRQPRPEAQRAVLDWLHHASRLGRAALPLLVVVVVAQGLSSLEWLEMRGFAQCAGRYTRVELVGALEPASLTA